MWWSGLRGGVAFALAIVLKGEDTIYGDYLFTTTIAISILTILIFGGGTLPLLRILKVEMMGEEIIEEGESKNFLIKLDEKFLRKIFIRREEMEINLEAPNIETPNIDLPTFSWYVLNLVIYSTK